MRPMPGMPGMFIAPGAPRARISGAPPRLRRETGWDRRALFFSVRRGQCFFRGIDEIRLSSSPQNDSARGHDDARTATRGEARRRGGAAEVPAAAVGEQPIRRAVREVPRGPRANQNPRRQLPDSSATTTTTTTRRRTRCGSACARRTSRDTAHTTAKKAESSSTRCSSRRTTTRCARETRSRLPGRRSGVPQLTDAEVAAVFKRVGHDAKGRVPHEVFVRALVLGDGRVNGGKKRSATARSRTRARPRSWGKIRYPQSRGGVYPPSDWLSRAGRDDETLRVDPGGDARARLRARVPGAATTSRIPSTCPSTGTRCITSRRWAWSTTRKNTGSGFFRGHDDDVRCIAAHPDGITFATGQDGREAVRVRVDRGGRVRPPMRGGWGGSWTRSGYLRSMVALAFFPGGRSVDHRRERR